MRYPDNVFNVMLEFQAHNLLHGVSLSAGADPGGPGGLSPP